MKKRKADIEIFGTWASLVGDPRLRETPADCFDGREFEAWSWCSHCEKAYQFKETIMSVEHRLSGRWNEEGEVIWLCAGYPECDGLLPDAWRWDEHLKSTGDGFLPDVPVRDVRFPCYPVDEKKS